jgi:acetyl-CoA carboxylase biotin carboxyl carrier protein
MSEKKTVKKPKKTNGASAPSSGPMDVDLLQQLVQLMTAHDLNTVDLRDGAKRVVLKRGAAAAAAPMMAYPAPSYAPVPQAPGASSTGTSATPAAPIDEDAGLLPIKSPMVGTFYAKATPDSKPFVSVGSRVDEDTDVCVIEAMKVFNNIKAERHGTIAKILVTDGQTVEFGTVLFLVKSN